METFVGIVFIVVCFLLIIVVLLQKGRGGGLGAAFGGAGSSAFGTRTGDVFTWITIVLTAVFLLLAIGATVLYRPPTGDVLKPKVNVQGPISGTTAVTVTCTTPNARIACTVTDTTTSPDSTKSSEPVEERAKAGAFQVQVKPGQTLRARAFRKNWTTSPMLTVIYEKTKPVTSKPVTSRPVTSRPATSRPTTTSGIGG